MNLVHQPLCKTASVALWSSVCSSECMRQVGDMDRTDCNLQFLLLTQRYAALNHVPSGNMYSGYRQTLQVRREFSTEISNIPFNRDSFTKNVCNTCNTLNLDDIYIIQQALYIHNDFANILKCNGVNFIKRILFGHSIFCKLTLDQFQQYKSQTYN